MRMAKFILVTIRNISIFSRTQWELVNGCQRRVGKEGVGGYNNALASRKIVESFNFQQSWVSQQWQAATPEGACQN